MHLRFFLANLLVVVTIHSFTGQNTSGNEDIWLNEVTVRSQRLEEFAIGAMVEKTDTTLALMLANGSLSDLLSLGSNLQVKTYGPGGLSTFSLRGGGNAHTAVMWNGINIQSPMNSGVNLSAMPALFFKDVKIQHGGAGTLYGSGAMSGVVHLNGENLFLRPNQLSAAVGYGSFFTPSANIALKNGNERKAFAFAAFAKKSDNDFEFINTARMDRAVQRQQNAGYSQAGILTDAHIRTSDNTMLTAALWLQHFDKEIQTQMFKTRPDTAVQIDNTLMGAVNFKWFGNGKQLNIKQGIIVNEVDYTDYIIPTNSGNNQSLSLVSEVESRININRHIWSVGANYTHEQGKSDGYRTTGSRDRLALFSFLHLKSRDNKLTTVLSVRDEMTNGELHPMVFALGSDYRLYTPLTLKGNISKNYRIPTFNDLNWAESSYARGNPNLKAESGWSGDLGVAIDKNYAHTAVSVSATAFITHVENWIVWLQGSDNVWMPTNKKTGMSRGIEFRMQNSHKSGSNLFGLNLSYNYIHSRLRTDDIYDGSQMTYIPRHSSNAMFSWNLHNITTAFTLNAAGERYYDATNKLEPYMTGDLMTAYKVPLSASTLTVTFRIANIWNTTYQTTAWYAMPNRHYEAGLRYNIKI